MLFNKTTRYKLLLALALGLAATSCKDDFNLPDQPLDNYIKVYMPQAVNGPVVKTLMVTDSIQSLVYGANLGGPDYAANDISVSFSVDNSKIDSFNKANNTSYAPLPDGSYNLSAPTAVIPKGKVSTDPLSIQFKTNGPGAMTVLKTYVLPISITGTKINVNEALRTAFFVVKAQPDLKDYPFYDRTGWQIINFSSQEAVGEGPNNGRAVFVLDNNTATFWHTQWQNGSPGPPHYLTIDMGKQQTIHGLSFTGRQGSFNGRPNEVNVQVSNDNSVYTDAGTFNLQNSKDQQSVFLSNGFKTARYFKVTINSMYSATYTHLTELNAF